jgi:hypothetical protein
MLGLVVFAVFFTFFFSVTLIFPSIPPGQLICGVLGNSETCYPVAGISGATVVSGLVNGLVWGVIIIILYSYSRGPQRGKVELPVWVPGYTQSCASADENNVPKQVDESSFDNFSCENAEPIESIEGIGSLYGQMLRDLGVNNVEDLLIMGSTQEGRQHIANKLEISHSLVLNWVIQAEKLL